VWRLCLSTFPKFVHITEQCWRFFYQTVLEICFPPSLLSRAIVAIKNHYPLQIIFRAVVQITFAVLPRHLLRQYCMACSLIDMTEAYSCVHVTAWGVSSNCRDFMLQGHSYPGFTEPSKVTWYNTVNPCIIRNFLPPVINVAKNIS
jgi:hypothetical protein